MSNTFSKFLQISPNDLKTTLFVIFVSMKTHGVSCDCEEIIMCLLLSVYHSYRYIHSLFVHENLFIKTVLSKTNFRKIRDSNPSPAKAETRVRDVRLQPLGQSSKHIVPLFKEGGIRLRMGDF